MLLILHIMWDFHYLNESKYYFSNSLQVFSVNICLYYIVQFLLLSDAPLRIEHDQVVLYFQQAFVTGLNTFLLASFFQEIS